MGKIIGYVVIALVLLSVASWVFRLFGALLNAAITLTALFFLGSWLLSKFNSKD